MAAIVGIISSLGLIGANLREPHSNVENGTVVHVQKTVTKSRIATHHYGLVRWFMYSGSCTNKDDEVMDISIQVLSNKNIWLHLLTFRIRLV